MTVTRSDKPWFKSGETSFISIDGMVIFNDRNYSNFAFLRSHFWSGILVGTDGYPTKDFFGYCIAGGHNDKFKAIAIEFYGVKKQI